MPDCPFYKLHSAKIEDREVFTPWCAHPYSKNPRPEAQERSTGHLECGGAWAKCQVPARLRKNF